MPLLSKGHFFMGHKKMKKTISTIQITILLVFSLCLSYLYYHTHQRPVFSIIIPTHNRAHMLPDIFKSIEESTFKNFEVILINDASKDNTKQVLKDYAKYKSNIIVLTNPKNLGMEGTRNRGIEFARGKYIGFMDDDDIFYKDWIEKNIEFFEKNPKVVATVPLRHNLVTPRTAQNNSPLSQILYGNVMGSSGAVIKKDFIDKHHIRFKKEFFGAEDYAFWHDILKNNGIVWRLPHFLVAIRSGAVHSKEHYQNADKTNSFISTSLRKHYSPDDNAQDLCNIYTNIQNTPIFAQQFDKNEIKARVYENCRTRIWRQKSKWIFVHPGWSDGIIQIDETTIKRYELPYEKATILQINGNEISVKWHNYGIETFICDKENTCSLKK